MIKVKRVYAAPGSSDGFRILVERLWPRGLTKEAVRADLWLKEIAPSDRLRKWFSHDPERWEEFRRRYADELSDRRDLFSRIREIEREKGTVTLLFSSKEERYNNAMALEEMLKRG